MTQLSTWIVGVAILVSSAAPAAYAQARVGSSAYAQARVSANKRVLTPQEKLLQKKKALIVAAAIGRRKSFEDQAQKGAPAVKPTAPPAVPKPNKQGNPWVVGN